MRFAFLTGIFALALAVTDTAGAAPFDFAALSALLRESPATHRPVQSVAELLPLLPRELRENFTLVYDSRSPFKDSIDPHWPRVILFNPDASLIITFTADPAKAGFDILEAIHFNAKPASFEGEKWVLPAALARNPALAPEAQRNGQPNPRDCVRCHGADFRPITDSYPIWPGFYGSVEDTFVPGSRELKNYRDFLAHQKENPEGPYRYLIWPKGTPVSPYLDPARFDPKKVEASFSDFKFLPNTRLGMALTELNRRRIFRKLKASPEYEKHKYSLLAGLLECGGSAADSLAAADMRDFASLENEHKQARLGSAPLGPLGGRVDMFEIDFASNLAEIDALALTARVSCEDWSMALEPSSVSFFDGILSGMLGTRNFYLKEDLIFEMLGDLAGSDLAFRPYFQPYAAYESLGYPFGHRLDLEAAVKACSLLKSRTN